MALTPYKYEDILHEWSRKKFNYETQTVFDTQEQEVLFQNSPDAELYKYVACPVCGEKRYTIFHEKTASRARILFGSLTVTRAMRKALFWVVGYVGMKRAASALSFILRRNITPRKIHHMRESGYTVVQCLSCQLLYRNPTYRPKALKEAYNNDYLSFLTGAYTAGRQKKFTEILRHLDFDAKTADLPNKRILDVGCGYGLFLSHIREKGWEPYGLDFAADCIDYAKTNLKLENVAVGNLESDSFEENYFGAVTLWSVAAHLDDPNKMFSDIRRVLAPGGCLVVYTVNAESYGHKEAHGYWTGFTRNHLVFYSNKTITSALKKAGFSEVEDRWDPDLYQQWLKSGMITEADREYFKTVTADSNCASMMSVIATKGSSRNKPIDCAAGFVTGDG